ncbi:MAG TPA: protein-L-isoaspartate(D-aspartate) O-methyltransferase [Thermohalobaculum sp.]|nr:protein-L-isoaspartate(D-aspartate) O-methyltransferase [Thermohalobaculum sp.]
MADQLDFPRLREEMVARQIEARGIRNPRVLEAMRTVPRECFVPPGLSHLAYSDGALPIDEHQTISQPYVVALMAEAAEPRAGDRSLDVGTGSGYAAAVMAQAVGHVWSVERIGALAEKAGRALGEAGIENVTVRVGDGTLGWPEEAPFDSIVVAAGAPTACKTLKHQLAPGGRLVIPVEAAGFQQLIRIRRTGEESFEQDELGAVRFVPLIGAEGWKEGRR